MIRLPRYSETSKGLSSGAAFAHCIHVTLWVSLALYYAEHLLPSLSYTIEGEAFGPVDIITSLPHRMISSGSQIQFAPGLIPAFGY